MGWDEAWFALAAASEEAERAELAAEVSDRTRAEYARVRLVDRLRAGLDRVLTVFLVGRTRVSGRLRDAGPDWLLIDESGGGVALVPLGAVVGVHGLAGRTATPADDGHLAQRLRLTYLLRQLARDRVPVTVVLVDATALTGTLDRTGADFVELAEHPAGEPRRARSVAAVRAVPHAAIAVVRETSPLG
ncbi:MAG: hypothetical protein M3P96_06775 [Actinomycetota bacterium]|nr:hypothetical protein [Actinomycetota bacterium]